MGEELLCGGEEVTVCGVRGYCGWGEYGVGVSSDLRQPYRKEPGMDGHAPPIGCCLEAVSGLIR